MLENRKGQQVPQVTFKVFNNGEWTDVTTDYLFKGKNVVLFALPGAYTPTCSSTHLPRYNELAPIFKANGVDNIICLSVNDTFVMNAWAKDQHSDHITLIPDGNGDFSEKMGLLVDKSAIGFGKRTWRYSMYVEDGTIKQMFIEPEQDGDPFEVSDADTMLKYLYPNAEKPSRVTIFTRKGCPHCARAKSLLSDNSMHYEEITIGPEVTQSTLQAVANTTATPQVFIDGKLVGGADDLEKWVNSR
ncbi:glutathione peroxidase [bacterium]|nr:glutathione peroxidase [bacterium]